MISKNTDLKTMTEATKQYLNSFQQKLQAFVTVPSIVLLASVNCLSEGQFIDQIQPLSSYLSVFKMITKHNAEIQQKGLLQFHSMKYTKQFLDQYKLESSVNIFHTLYYNSGNLLTDFFGSVLKDLEDVRLKLQSKLYSLEEQTQLMYKQPLKLTMAKAASDIPSMLNKLDSMATIIQTIDKTFVSLIPGGALISQMAFLITVFAELYLDGILCELHFKNRLNELSYILSTNVTRQKQDVLVCDIKIKDTFRICWKKILSLLIHNITVWKFQQLKKIQNLAEANLTEKYLISFRQQMINIPKVINSNLSYELKQQILLMMYASQQASKSMVFVNFLQKKENIFLESMKQLQAAVSKAHQQSVNGVTMAKALKMQAQDAANSERQVMQQLASMDSLQGLTDLQEQIGLHTTDTIIQKVAQNTSVPSVVQNMELNLANINPQQKGPYMKALCDAGESSMSVIEQISKQDKYGIGKQIKIGLDKSQSQSLVSKTYNQTCADLPLNLLALQKAPQIQHQGFQMKMLVTKGKVFVHKIGQQINKQTKIQQKIITDSKEQENTLKTIFAQQEPEQKSEQTEMLDQQNKKLKVQPHPPRQRKSFDKVVLTKLGLYRRQQLNYSDKMMKLKQFLENESKKRSSQIAEISNYINFQLKGMRSFIQNRVILMQQRVQQLKRQIPQQVLNGNQLLMNQLTKSLLDEMKVNLGSFAADIKLKTSKDLDMKIQAYLEEMKKNRVINEQDLTKYFSKLQKMGSQTDVYLKSTLGTILTAIKGTVKQFEDIKNGNQANLIKIFNQRISSVQNSISTLQSQNSISSKKILNSLVMGIDMLKNITLRMKMNQSENNANFEKTRFQMTTLNNKMSEIQKSIAKSAQTYNSLIDKNSSTIIKNIQSAQNQYMEFNKSQAEIQKRYLEDQKMANKGFINMINDNKSAFENFNTRMANQSKSIEKTADLIANNIVRNQQLFKSSQNNFQQLQSFSLKSFNEIQNQNNKNYSILFQNNNILTRNSNVLDQNTNMLNENKLMLSNNVQYLQSTIQKCNTIIQRMYQSNNNIVNLLAITQSLSQQINNKFPQYQQHFVMTQSIMIQLTKQIQVSEIKSQQGFYMLGNMINSVNTQAVSYLSNKMESGLGIIYSGLQNSQSNISKKLDEIGANSQKIETIKNQANKLLTQKTEMQKQMAKLTTQNSKLQSSREASLKNLIRICQITGVRSELNDSVQTLTKKSLQALQSLEGRRKGLSQANTTIDLSNFQKVFSKLMTLIPEKAKIEQAYNNLLKVKQQLDRKTSTIQKQIVKTKDQKLENEKKIQSLNLEKQKADIHMQLMELIKSFTINADSSTDIFALLSRTNFQQWLSFVAVLKRNIDKKIAAQLDVVNKQVTKKQQLLRQKTIQLQTQKKIQIQKENAIKARRQITQKTKNIEAEEYKKKYLNLQDHFKQLQGKLKQQQRQVGVLDGRLQSKEKELQQIRQKMKQAERNPKLIKLTQQLNQITQLQKKQRAKITQLEIQIQNNKVQATTFQNKMKLLNASIDQLNSKNKQMTITAADYRTLMSQLQKITSISQQQLMISQIKKVFQGKNALTIQTKVIQTEAQKLKLQLKQQKSNLIKTKAQIQESVRKVYEKELQIQRIRLEAQTKLKGQRSQFQNALKKNENDYNMKLLQIQSQNMAKQSENMKSVIFQKDKQFSEMQSQMKKYEAQNAKMSKIYEQENVKLKNLEKQLEQQKKKMKVLQSKEELMEQDIKKKSKIIEKMIQQKKQQELKKDNFQSQLLKVLNSLNIEKYMIDKIKQQRISTQTTELVTKQSKIKQILELIKIVLESQSDEQAIVKNLKEKLIKFNIIIEQKNLKEQLPKVFQELNDKLINYAQKQAQLQTQLKRVMMQLEKVNKNFQKMQKQYQTKVSECQLQMKQKVQQNAALEIAIDNLKKSVQQRNKEIESLKLQIETLKVKLEEQSNYKNFKSLLDRLAVQMCGSEENSIEVLKQIYASITTKQLPPNLSSSQLVDFIINENSSAVFLTRLRNSIRKKYDVNEVQELKKQNAQFLKKQKQRQDQINVYIQKISERDKDIGIILELLSLYQKVFSQVFKVLLKFKQFFNRTIIQFKDYIKNKPNSEKVQVFVKVVTFFQSIYTIIQNISKLVPIAQFIEKYKSIPDIIKRHGSGLDIGIEKIQRLIEQYDEIK